MQNIKVELETATDKALETGDSMVSDLLVAGVASQQVSSQNSENASERELTPADLLVAGAGFEPATFRL